ncbi:MAG TPA: HPF/RaiA family ribosome-associated protein [Patescibacteria group bacterium]
MVKKYFYKNINDQEKALFQDYFETKIKQLHKYLKRYDDNELKLSAKAEKFATKHAYKVTFTLALPANQLMAWEDDHTISEAVDLAYDKLVIQLSKLHKRLTKK